MPGPVDRDEPGRAGGTDFFRVDDLLDPAERAVRDRVRAWCDAEVVPVDNAYWERAELFAARSRASGSCRRSSRTCSPTRHRLDPVADRRTGAHGHQRLRPSPSRIGDARTLDPPLSSAVRSDPATQRSVT